MLLAFSFSDIIRIPFGYALDLLYQLTNSYGLALILFALLVQVVLLPITAKSKKSMMKMSRMQPRLQALQKKYANDQQKQNEAIQQLYKDEGVSMGGGCLWSLVPMLILFPLYQVIRQPMVYMFHETAEVAAQVIQVIKTADPSLFTSNDYYDQIIAMVNVPNFLTQIKDAGITLNEATQAGLNVSFLGGINLGAIADWQFWNWDKFDWPHFGALLIPVLSAGSQVVSMLISQKANNSVITNEKGVQDTETANNSQQAQTSKTIMYMMPLMSLWIGFTIPAALSLYWLVGGVVRTVEDMILTNHYRKIYDAEDAVRLQKYLEEERIEAEKERLRAEKRAANPEGITENTSKKKLQQKQKAEEAAAKAAAKKEYDAKRGIVEEEKPEKQTLSGIADRPYCKGRAYDPNRYNTEE